MLSWHKVGQEVVCLNSSWCWTRPTLWERVKDLLGWKGPDPVEDQILVIAGVEVEDGEVYLVFDPYPGEKYNSNCFRPIYRAAVERLLKLGAPSPEIVKEDA